MAVHGIPSRPVGLNDQTAAFRDDVLRGLSASPKTLPCKYLYDSAGSALFDRICDLPEYYPTRTELGILRRHAGEMAAALGDGCLLIEYGSGSAVKTPLLLERMREPIAYVPVDVSRDHLLASASGIAARFPDLDVIPVWGDFTSGFEVPTPSRPPKRRAVYFPGSTIGNFPPREAVRLLEGIARRVGIGGHLLIGVDLWKSESILSPAYDDAQGVTAAFNKNLLVRINRELGGDFNLASFEHRAVVNPRCRRVEMHLVCSREQLVTVGDATFRFAVGETICTEHSHKYSLDGFADLAQSAGLSVRQVWMDPQELFSVQLLEAVM